jgi:hypothetical protein
MSRAGPVIATHHDAKVMHGIGISDARHRCSDAQDRRSWVARGETTPGGHKGRPYGASRFRRLAPSYVRLLVVVTVYEVSE